MPIKPCEAQFTHTQKKKKKGESLWTSPNQF